MFKKDVLSQLNRTGDRRKFLKIFGGLGLGLAGGGAIQAAFNVVKLGDGKIKVSQTRLAMGTYVTITAVGPSRDQAQEATGRAFEEIDRLIAIFSRYESSSPVSVLNQAGYLNDPPPELARLAGESLRYHSASNGAFDVTVLPLIELFKHTVGTDAGTTPTRDETIGALERVGSEYFEAAPNGPLAFRRSGMGITLDSIAKGYIVDRASHVLTAHGIEDHLINAGGDIRTRGYRPDEKPWTVAIEDPQKKKRYPDVIHLSTGAVATSGSYEVYYDEEKTYHHVVDPRTGFSPDHSVSVSVRADSAMEADALSTAVFVLGPVEGVRMIEAMPRTECLVLDKSGSQYRSRGWTATNALEV